MFALFFSGTDFAYKSTTTNSLRNLMMEIKEINNNSLLSMLQMNKNNMQSGNITNMNFGNMLASLGNLSTVKTDVKEDFSQAKEKISSNFSSDDIKNSPSYESQVSVKEETPQKAEDNKVEKPKSDRAKESHDSSEETQVKENDKPAESQKERTEPSETKENVAEEVKTNTEADKPEEIKNKDLSVDKDVKEVSIDALSLLGMVTVVNPVDGTQIPVSGEELASALSSQGVETISLTEGLDGQVEVIMPEAETPELSAFQEALKSFEVVSDGVEMQPVKTQSLAEKESSETLSLEGENNVAFDEQASQLSEMTGNRKIKVEVKVKEEKIADKIDGGLVKENKLSDNVLSAIMSGDEQANPLVETKTPAINTASNAQTMQNQIAQGKLAGVAVAQNNVASPLADDGASLSLDNNTTTLAQAGSLGHENLSNSKVAANDTQNTSFRDVYKGMSKEVIDQVKVNITKSAVKGVDKVEIQLKPEDLGHIEVKMQIGKDGKLQAHIIASRPETAEMLQKDIASLQKAFNEAGFQTDEGSLSFSFRNEGQSNQEQERNNLRNFIGQALEQEAAMDIAGNDTLYNDGWNGANGLNIRV